MRNRNYLAIFMVVEDMKKISVRGRAGAEGGHLRRPPAEGRKHPVRRKDEPVGPTVWWGRREPTVCSRLLRCSG